MCVAIYNQSLLRICFIISKFLLAFFAEHCICGTNFRLLSTTIRETFNLFYGFNFVFLFVFSGWFTGTRFNISHFENPFN